MYDLIKQLQQWSPALYAIVFVFGAIGGTCTAIHTFLAVLAVRFPALTPWSRGFATAGIDLQKWSQAGLSFLKKILGGSGGGPAAGVGALVLVILFGVSVTPARAARVHLGGVAACSNPQTALNVARDVSQAAAVADGIAESAWAAAQPFIPPANLATATADWNKAQDGYTAAQGALQAAIAAGTDATSQQWTAMVSAIETGIDAVVTALEQFGVVPTGAKVSLMAPEFATKMAALRVQQKTLHRYH
jgi:hypothetical protein